MFLRDQDRRHLGCRIPASLNMMQWVSPPEVVVGFLPFPAAASIRNNNCPTP